MRRSILIGLFSLFPWTANAAVEALFTPIPNVPDYVATITSEEPATFTSKKDVPVRRTIYHHGAWTRIEREAGDIRSNTYINGEIPIIVIVDPASGFSSNLAIIAGSQARQSWMHPRSKTGDHDTVLGERCEIWLIRDNLRSCVTTDGIELWRKSFHPQTVIALERRAVAESDVRPPPHIFDWKTWSGPPPESAATSAPPDAVVTMEPTADAPPSQRGKRRIMRHHLGWTYIENVKGETKRAFWIENRSMGLHLRAETYPDGQFASLMLYRLDNSTRLAPRPVVPLKAHDKETILGEECTWFDPSPGMMDAWNAECRTMDGLVLKNLSGGRGFNSTRSMIATRIERAPIALADVLPPYLLEPSNWGLPASALGPRQ